MPIPGIAIMGAAGAAGGGLSYQYWSTQRASSSNPTFSSVAIGDADAHRMVVVCLTFNSFAMASAVTIGGVSATLAKAQTLCQIWYAEVPTGTTANISVTTSAGYTNCAVFTLHNPNPTKTPSNTGGTTASGTTVNLFSTVPVNGIGFCVVCSALNATYTATNYTEEFDAATLNSSASFQGGTFTVSNTLTATMSTSGTKYFAYASWGP